MTSSNNTFTSKTWLGLLIVVFAITAQLILFGVDYFQLNVPLAGTYENTDGRMTMAVFKSIIDGSCDFSGIISTDRLSAPFKFESFDFPMPMFAVIFFIKLLTLFSSDYIVVFNLFILSTFYLNAGVMYFVLRKLSISIGISVAVSLIFTFLPFHYFRLGHTFYLGYFFIPFWIYIALKLFDKQSLFFTKKQDATVFDKSFTSTATIILLLLSSTWNFYYTFFYDLLLFFVFLTYLLKRFSKNHYKSLLIVICLVNLPLLINLLPYKYQQYKHGVNLQVAQRNPIESEIYGLKISQLVLPVSNHRIESWSKLKESYDSNSILFNESQDASLGLMGTIGFLFLLYFAIFRQRSSNHINILSQFNMLSVLFATVGGFSVVFAYFITPDIRAYNRICVFIATFSFLALAMLSQIYVTKLKLSRSIVGIVLLTVTFLSVLDESPKNLNLSPWGLSHAEFLSDKAFISDIEAQFKDTSFPLVAELPYMSYPENGAVEKMHDYEHILGYIHSEKIKWSYGAVRGREADAWWSELNSESIADQIKTLQQAGFSGVLINRRGYTDRAKKLESNLSNILEVSPLESYNKELLFFPLIPTGKVVHVPLMYEGFYPWEGVIGGFRWAGENAALVIYCDDPIGCIKHISFEVASLVNRSVLIKQNGNVINVLKVDQADKRVDLHFNLKSGKNFIEFVSETPAVSPSDIFMNTKDSRALVFSMKNLIVN